MSIFSIPAGGNRVGASDTSGGGYLTLVNSSLLPLNITKGALMICMVTSSSSTELTDPTSVMYDDFQNTWQYGGKNSNGNGLTQYLFYCLSNVTAGRNTVYVYGNGGEDFFAAYLLAIPISGGYATFDTFG